MPERCEKAVNALKKFYAWRDGNTADTTDGEEVRLIDFMKLCVRIDRAYGFALKSVASANGETIAEVVVSAIAAYLHKHSKQAKRAFDIYFNR